MEQYKIPKPEFNLNYQFKKVEDFANLRVIDVLWILTMNSYNLALTGIRLQHEKYNHATKISAIEAQKTKEEIEEWINYYLKKNSPFWLVLKKNYGQSIKLCLNEIALLFEMAEQNPSLFKDLTPDINHFLKKIVYSGFYKSIRKGKFPTIFQCIYLLLFVDITSKPKGYEKYFYPYFKRDFLSLVYTIIKRDQQEVIPKLSVLINSMFGKEAFEIYTHYAINYMSQEGELGILFQTNNDKLEIQEIQPPISISLEPPPPPISKVKMTQSQIVLLYYYFFKYHGLEPRVDIDISPLARFIHLTTGITFTKIQNSDIYSKLQKAPNFKTDKELIKDLNVIKEYFREHEFHDIIKLIENEISMSGKSISKK